MTDFHTDSETPVLRRLSPAHWAVILVTTLASWEVGQTVVRWVYSYLVPNLWQVIPSTPGRISDLVLSVLHAVLSALIAAPLAYGVAKLVMRRL
jgi:hypothetical protein